MGSNEFLKTHGIGIIISVLAMCLLGAIGGIYTYGKKQASAEAERANIRHEIVLLQQRQDQDDAHHEEHSLRLDEHYIKFNRLQGMVDENTWGVKYINCWHTGRPEAECVYDVPWIFNE